MPEVLANEGVEVESIRRHLSTFVVALVAGAVGAGTPAIAHGVKHALFAHNSAKVDGKDAVGSGASIDSRKGKLVATNAKTGRLPNNIIAKAPDADKLQGLPASSFLQTGDPLDANTLEGQAASSFVKAGEAITAPNYLYSDPVDGSIFVDPAHCQRATNNEAPYGSTNVYHPPANGLGPGIGGSAATANTNLGFYCPVSLPVPASGNLRITGGDVQFMDNAAGCLMAAHLRTKNFGGVDFGAIRGSTYSGSDGTDYAFVSGDAFTRVGKSFPSMSLSVAPTTIVFVEAVHANAPAGGSTQCRYNGTVLHYTIDRP